MKFHGPVPDNSTPPCTGILITNLGTPDSPAVADVRSYLQEFLSDPRVVEVPRLLWWLVLHGVILRIRPKRSAAAYRKVWTDRGSPLLTLSRAIADALQQTLDQRLDGPTKVVLAMRYGSPSIAEGLETLRRANARRILVLPLYPQYSATTTASTFDEIGRVLRGWRWLPELRFINHYHDAPGYIGALAESVTEFARTHGACERLLLSFHGIPQSYADQGDPYAAECRATAERLAAALALSPDQWAITFQSRVGRQAWLRPYTDETLKQWGANGIKRVHVLCPGFPADCLETLEEIGAENREYFLSAGGEEYHYIPALNDRAAHIDFLAELVRHHHWRNR
ncbi:ferrochelatase [Sedimenticola hydrogenitrophicus]|uniref:ferrochelatase n=1 Tax=Sedimenticola hydrogenitrophicus TaxID=2967975 RepID=UPI0023AF0940|nr:ferrochelatase [Sedimenticola hydrogenitrophicus]